jgi:hypothetical protein
MAYLAVDQHGTETIYDFEPYRCGSIWVIHDYFDEGQDGYGIELPKGTIEKIIGRTLSWEDEPYDLS